MNLHLLSAWIAIALGMLSGAAVGLFFRDPQWLGGYGSWERRLLRLGHIAFFGLGLINIAYGLTIGPGGWEAPHPALSWLLVASNFLMPAVCFLSAWRKPLAMLFPIPVGCALIPVLGLLIGRIA